MQDRQFFVITGGPGAGKTTLLQGLRARGFTCVEESARRVIQEQMRSGGNALPWGDTKRFKELMLHESLYTYQQAVDQGKHLVFFDRGVLDLIAYDRRTETVSSPELRRAVKNLVYHRMVFVAPPWKEIFCTDRERKQNFTEATAVYHSLVDVYQEFNFDLVILPKTSVPERIDFVLEKVEECV